MVTCNAYQRTDGEKGSAEGQEVGIKMPTYRAVHKLERLGNEKRRQSYLNPSILQLS